MENPRDETAYSARRQEDDDPPTPPPHQSPVREGDDVRWQRIEKSWEDRQQPTNDLPPMYPDDADDEED